MPILAALVARDTTVLAEYGPLELNFSAISRRLLQQIPTGYDNKRSYSHESYLFHYVVEGGITFVCMTDQKDSTRIPFALLYDLATRFKTTYGDKAKFAQEMSFQSSFARVIQERINFYSNDRNVDSISRVKGDLTEAKDVMGQNLNKMIERGEKIEVLVSKTNDLETSATSFKKNSTHLKRTMCCQNFRLTLILSCVCIIILAAVTCGILWWLGVFSIGSSNSPTPTTAPQSSTSFPTKSETITSAPTTSRSAPTTTSPTQTTSLELRGTTREPTANANAK